MAYKFRVSYEHLHQAKTYEEIDAWFQDSTDDAGCIGGHEVELSEGPGPLWTAILVRKIGTCSRLSD